MFVNKLITRSILQGARYCIKNDTTYLRTISNSFVHRYSSQQGNSQDISFKNEKVQKYLELLRQEFYALRVNSSGTAKDFKRINQLDGIVRSIEQYRAVEGNMVTKEDLENEKDEDMRQLIKEENEIYTKILQQTEQEVMSQMLGLTDNEEYSSVIFEVNAGAGGQEAMLFAKELFDMYINYFEHNNWDYEILTEDSTDIGGLRHANVIVKDPEAYSNLRYEGGVHRVQRVPTTDKSGRIHTSTASIAVIPRPDDVNIIIAEKDLKIETKRASGAGGQHVNTTDSAVRMVHLPTGVAVECQTERSQIKNREIALKRLHAKLFQQKLESVQANTQASRKAQQGNLNRNEKIRTYNFVQDRITDHRIKDGTMHNLEVFLKGGEQLAGLISKIMKEDRKVKFADMILNSKDESAKEQRS